jgi:hypothetical protein
MPSGLFINSKASEESTACILHILPWRWKKLIFKKYRYFSRRRHIQEDCNNPSICHCENLICHSILPKRSMEPQTYIIAGEKAFLQQIANNSSTVCLCKLSLHSHAFIQQRYAAGNTKTFNLTLHNVSFTLLCHVITMIFKNSICLYTYGSKALMLNLGRFFSFLIFFTIGRTPWKGDQAVARPLPAHRTVQTHTDIYASCRIRTHDPSVWAGERHFMF